jgi:hypothetical protein
MLRRTSAPMTLIQSRDGPDRWGAAGRFETMPSRPPKHLAVIRKEEAYMSEKPILTEMAEPSQIAAEDGTGNTAPFRFA